MSMMYPGVTGMVNTNQQQGQNFNVAMQAMRYMRRGNRRSNANSGGLNAQQLADLATHHSQLKLNEMTHGSNLAREEVTHTAETADQEYIRAHGAAPDQQTGLVPGGHIGAARRANATFDQNGRVNGNTAWTIKPSAGGGLSGGGFSAGTIRPQQQPQQQPQPQGKQGPLPFPGTVTVVPTQRPTQPTKNTRATIALPTAPARQAITAGPATTAATPTGPANKPGVPPINPVAPKKARRVLGSVLKSVIPVAEAAGEALL